MADGDRPLLSVREAARLIGIGKDLAYAMVAENRLPVVRFGRRVLVHRALLLRWLHAEAAAAAESVSSPSVLSGSEMKAAGDR